MDPADDVRTLQGVGAVSDETRYDRHDSGGKPAGPEGNNAKHRLARWMSGFGDKPSPGEDVIDMASMLTGDADPDPSGGCEFVSASLAEYAELSEEAAKSEMPQVAAHLQSCPECSEELALLKEMFSGHGDWVKLAAAVGGIEPRRLLVAIANTWHWLTEAQDPPVGLKQEDLTLGRGLGGWILLPQRAEVMALSRGQGILSPLALTWEFTRGARINVIVTPEQLASTHRQMWRINFELAAGSSVQRVQLDLTTYQKQSRGMRALRPDRTVEYQVDPPVDGCYLATLIWEAGGQEMESVLELPLRAQARKDG